VTAGAVYTRHARLASNDTVSSDLTRPETRSRHRPRDRNFAVVDLDSVSEPECTPAATTAIPVALDHRRTLQAHAGAVRLTAGETK
jgi:hypothetical protein